MKKDLIDTIMEKEYNELSAAERAELQEFCSSESEYTQMKEVFASVEAMKFETPQPRKETKERLDNLFAETYPKAAPIWYSSVGAAILPKDKPLHRQPLMQIAAVGLLLVLIYPLWNARLSESPKPNQSASVEQKATSESEPKSKSTTAEAEPVKDETSNEDALTQDLVASNLSSESRADVVPPAEPGGLFGDASPATSATVSAGTTSTFAFTNASVNDMTTFAGSPVAEHPDGVFVAVSQPASDDPELFDLLTTTF